MLAVVIILNTMKKVKVYIVRKLIDYCCKRALRHEQRKEMLLSQKGIEFIYAVGSNDYDRDIWLNRIKYLQKMIRK
jgi:hypothetical protein